MHTCPRLPEASAPFEVPHWSETINRGLFPHVHSSLQPCPAVPEPGLAHSWLTLPTEALRALGHGQPPEQSNMEVRSLCFSCLVTWCFGDLGAGGRRRLQPGEPPWPPTALPMAMAFRSGESVAGVF